jgi:aldehyde:ferredoxin oxidoreductase
MEKVIRVNLTEKSVLIDSVPYDDGLLGGRGLIAKIVNREIPPLCDPLGQENKLIVCPGPLAGTMAPSFGRVSIGGKSPLTGGIKEANAGGPAGQILGKLGIRAIIIEGKSEEEAPCVLKIGPETQLFTPF